MLLTANQKLVMHTNSSDTGGQCYKTREAFNQFSNEYEVRSLLLGKNYLDYPADILFSKYNPNDVNALLDRMDILHAHNSLNYYCRWRQDFDIPIILHQHGRFGSDVTNPIIEKADLKYKAYRVVSTMNLLNYVGNDPARWLPAPVDLARMQEMRARNYKDDGIIRICHAPTMGGKHKDTDMLLRAFDILKLKYQNIELVLLQNMSNESVLQAKSRCDICYDQLLLWYGNNALEAWSFGMPVVCGMGSHVREISVNYFGYEPWVYSDRNQESLTAALESLIISDDYRRKMGQFGIAHVQNYHDYPATVRIFSELYRRMLS